LVLLSNFRDSITDDGQNAFLIKLSYWLGIQNNQDHAIKLLRYAKEAESAGLAVIERIVAQL